jgi:hypothetical protein
MAKRIHGITNLIKEIVGTGERFFCTVPELVRWIQVKIPEANHRSIEVMLTRDLVRKGFFAKTNFKTRDFSKTGHWRSIYVWKKKADLMSLEGLNNIYTTVKEYDGSRTSPLSSIKKKSKIQREPLNEPRHDETELEEGEISAYDLGRKVIEYIAELKQSLRKKDEETGTLMRNFGEREKELKADLAKLNEKLSEQNKEMDVLRNSVKRFPKGERPHGSFKLGDVAHIK